MTKSTKRKKRRPTKRAGQKITYTMRGKQVSRTIGIRKKPFSDNEKAKHAGMSVTQKFINSINPFLRLGFDLEAEITGRLRLNIAFSLIWKNALKGKYPDLYIAFDQVQISKGSLNPPKDPKAVLVNRQVVFTWGYDGISANQHWSDQVMLLVYFPEINKATYLAAGPERQKQTAEINLPKYKGIVNIETYISFVSSDRRAISNSTYLGRLTL